MQTRYRSKFGRQPNVHFQQRLKLGRFLRHEPWQLSPAQGIQGKALFVKCCLPGFFLFPTLQQALLLNSRNYCIKRVRKRVQKTKTRKEIFAMRSFYKLKKT